MSETELTYFQMLKQEVASRLRTAFPEVGTDIEQWKGKEIRLLQEDLIEKVNGRVSEKWFYTHVKSAHAHLPRIDMLDLLSQYVGFENWDAFKASKGLTDIVPTRISVRKKQVFWIAAPLCLVVLVVFYMNAHTSEQYQFCFVNAYNQEAIQDASLDIIMLHNEESPYRIKAGEDGCIQVQTNQDEVRFIVKGPYYQTDTIVRRLDKQQMSEQVALKTNDYAWMIHVFSHSNVEDWQQRRTQLDSMIREDARIFQIFDEKQIGMEMYNKWEFIDKLTMPIQSLRNIEILEMQYAADKIKELRFKQTNPPSHE
ncbi:hypothetical protein [Catalinimonas niigatensis]|uniref:hypothetical protein n=1 Tax=Catalinimonas niigatensis TaxID=1397264 RepID=UPI002665E924|nr:hypothetical protein [Catalinimonas niigatensis]WPP53043.1 hypothetical protein PZB72_11715 [Catalinimonas niigatensis]